jgi:hypothetical protein
MHPENKKRRRDEQPSLLCFSDTMNRRPLPIPPGNDTLVTSRLDDSQLKEFEKLLQTSKNKDISEYIEEESMSFTREGLGRFNKRRTGAEDITNGLSKLAGIVLAFGEKIDRLDRRMGGMEEEIRRISLKGTGGKELVGDVGYKAHTISTKMKTKHKGNLKKKNSLTMNLGNSNKLQLGQSLYDDKIKMLEKESMELKMKNKALRIDKNILMKMIKDMIDKNPESCNAIDHELFLKTLGDQ